MNIETTNSSSNNSYLPIDTKTKKPPTNVVPNKLDSTTESSDKTNKELFYNVDTPCMDEKYADDFDLDASVVADPLIKEHEENLNTAFDELNFSGTRLASTINDARNKFQSGELSVDTFVQINVVLLSFIASAGIITTSVTIASLLSKLDESMNTRHLDQLAELTASIKILSGAYDTALGVIAKLVAKDSEHKGQTPSNFRFDQKWNDGHGKEYSMYDLLKIAGKEDNYPYIVSEETYKATEKRPFATDQELNDWKKKHWFDQLKQKWMDDRDEDSKYAEFFNWDDVKNEPYCMVNGQRLSIDDMREQAIPLPSFMIKNMVRIADYDFGSLEKDYPNVKDKIDEEYAKLPKKFDFTIDKKGCILYIPVDQMGSDFLIQKFGVSKDEDNYVKFNPAALDDLIKYIDLNMPVFENKFFERNQGSGYDSTQIKTLAEIVSKTSDTGTSRSSQTAQTIQIVQQAIFQILNMLSQMMQQIQQVYQRV